MKTRTLLLALAVIAASCGDDLEPKGKALNNSTTVNNTTLNNTTPDNSCMVDEDCTGDEVCFSTECLPLCTSRADCERSELCLPRLDGDGSVCQPTECIDDAPCIEFYGNGALCADDGFCRAPAERPDAGIQRFKLEDNTVVVEACDSSDPGADISGVQLVDANGNSRGWADLVSEMAQTAGNGEYNPGIINGEEPALDFDGCPDIFSGNVFSLGCRGSFIFEFVDAAGEPIQVQVGDEIFVYEYGGTCSTGTTDDAFNLYACIGGSCDTFLGSGTGVDSFVVEQ